jgi:hypothetical protein
VTDEEFKATFNLPFKEASSFFRLKLAIPTERWDDLWQEQHAKGFMVAGAGKSDLLADFYGEVQKAIDGKLTLKEFQGQFDSIVTKHGWAYNGGRNWRSALIYDTNVSTAYQAGRWQQFVESSAPALRYVHADGVMNPRPLHVAWNGTVRPLDDPFWKMHYPPNGWGCHCRAVRAELSEVTAAPAGYDEIDPKTGAPHGIDRGWAYNVGQAYYGTGPKEDPKGWKPLRSPSLTIVGRQQDPLPFAPVQHRPGPAITDQDGMVEAVRTAIGGDDKVFIFQSAGLEYGLHVNAEWLGKHLDRARAPYLPYLADLLLAPAEVWLDWEQHEATGKVRVGMNILKGIDLGKGKVLYMAAKAGQGEMEAWTFFATEDLKYVEKQRAGLLAYKQR